MSGDSLVTLKSVLNLSEKYQLTRLKAIVEATLTELVARDNVCELLAVAHLVGARRLREACVRYFRTFQRDVMRSDAWKRFRKSYTALALDVLEEVTEPS